MLHFSRKKWMKTGGKNCLRGQRQVEPTHKRQPTTTKLARELCFFTMLMDFDKNI